MLLETRRLTYLGLLLAINQVVLLLPTIFTYNTLFFYSFAAVLVGVVIVDFGMKQGVIFYIASSLLAFILIPNKIQILTYIGFLALYAIVKYCIEKYISIHNKSVVLEFILKELFFNSLLVLVYFFIQELISLDLTWWMILMAEGFFIIYDYLFGYFMHFYMDKIKPRMKYFK